MANSEELRLQWKEFPKIVGSAFEELKDDLDLRDVTLVCKDGNKWMHTCRRNIKRYKLVFKYILAVQKTKDIVRQTMVSPKSHIAPFILPNL